MSLPLCIALFLIYLGQRNAESKMFDVFNHSHIEK